MVVHSTTKYLGGHSDVVGGALVLNDDALYEQAKFHQFAVGAVSGPLDAWLTTRGINTSLALVGAEGLQAYVHGDKARAAEDLATVAEEIAARAATKSGEAS